MSTSFHLYLRSDSPRKNGEYPIYLRITSNRKHKYLSTGISVFQKHWNSDKEVIRKTHPSYKALNKTLSIKLSEAKNAQAELITYGKDNAKSIKARLKVIDETDFFSFAEDYLKLKQRNGKHSQYVQGVVAFNKIEEFEGERLLRFNQIDSEYLKSFQDFLINDHKNKASTVKKTFQPIKKVIKRAISEHLLHIDPFLNFEMVTNSNPPSKIKLSIEQIEGIKALELEKNTWLWNTKNAFLFSFYSAGIRFGDICCLKWENVKDGRLNYQMNKNEKAFSTELNDYQKEVLGKYSGQDDSFIFPFLNNHKDYSDPIKLRKDISSKNMMVNKSLKKIVIKLNDEIDKGNISAPKINANVSFHVSRHSFAQHAVQSGLSIYELMQTLRHSKLETTQKYLKSLNEELADKAMKKIF
ncbi:hypothetical protein A8B79_02470 [Balneola sp. EhC07]|uniref:site-specific integrase n=1 Tax=Balneola sp. EhC07 TaxID=1849360 RepID=UPI0007F3F9FA|nr:site-specific integrase [Balneola sp. EhC07]OAN62435.1 hypothetical protein A8B79_02470 [Balneola sp. EhC07]